MYHPTENDSGHVHPWTDARRYLLPWLNTIPTNVTGTVILEFDVLSSSTVIICIQIIYYKIIHKLKSGFHALSLI